MKKLFLTMCVALFSIGAFAQEKGEMAVGGSLNFNTDASMLGIGARYQYFLIDNLRADGEFTYYLKKDGVTSWTILASANYLFNVADNIDVYPIAGLGYAHSSFDYGIISGSGSDFIGQIGAGAQYFFTDNIGANFDAKYQFGSGGAFVLAAGIIYKF